MRSKHDIPNKADYMKAYSFNLIQTERTNSELEHEKNVGKIDGAFYRIYSWQIMGKQRERQLSHTDSKETAKVKKLEALNVIHSPTNGRVPEESINHESVENKILVQSRTDFKGNSPKKYITTCYFKQKTIPAWYTESLVIRIGSTKRYYNEKVWLKNKLQPYYWTESMTTEVNQPPTKAYSSQIAIPIVKSETHYISLETQQITAGAS